MFGALGTVSMITIVNPKRDVDPSMIILKFNFCSSMLF